MNAPRLSSKAKRALLVDLVCIGVLISLCLFIALPRFRVGINWADEGFLAYGAVRVLEGQMPNRDFVSLQPPLSFYVLAAAFKTFGTSLVTLRGLGLSIYLLLPLLIYGISRHLMSGAIAFTAALPAAVLGIPYFNFVPFAVWQGITITLGAVLLYLNATLKGRPWLAGAAGVLTSMSILARHDQGVYLALSIVVLSIALSRSGTRVKLAFRAWAIGAIVTALLFLVFAGLRGALPEMFRQLVLFPLHSYAKTSSLPFPQNSFQLSLSQNATILLFFAAPVAFVLGTSFLIWRIVRNGFDLSEALLSFLLAWAILSYAQVLTRSDLEHLLITLPPLFILFGYGLNLVRHHFADVKLVNMSILSCAAILGFTFLWIIRPVVLPNVKTQTQSLAFARGGVRIEDGDWLTEFVRGVQKNVPADRAILAFPYQPMFYFLCERRNPTRWNYLWPGDQSEAEHAALIEQAESDPPAVIFLTDESDMSIYAPSIVEYAHRDYHRVGDFGPLNVYFPNSPAR
ncbi:MAG: hypothetical protein ABJB69_05220 [Spartobacteria bacterium]